MSQTRRMGPEDSEVRARYIDAAEAILQEEGYHGISARRVAAKTGLKPQLLYYYFRTMDDLLLALLRRINEQRLERFEEALAMDDPLQALWALNSNPSGAIVASEMTSIAAHREAVRNEIVRSAEAFRIKQIEAVARLLPPQKRSAAAGLVMIAIAVARSVTTEAALGLTVGHKEVLEIVEHMLAELRAPAD